MRRKVRLTENDLHRIIMESVKNYLYETERQYNRGDYVRGRNGVITDQLGVTYEQVRNVYYALHGYANYDPRNEDAYEKEIEEWWNRILSNARRQNQSYGDNLPSRKMKKMKFNKQR